MNPRLKHSGTSALGEMLIAMIWCLAACSGVIHPTRKANAHYGISDDSLIVWTFLAAAEVELKSPFVPLFSKGEFLPAILTPLCQRGEGEIFGRNDTGIMHQLLLR